MMDSRYSSASGVARVVAVLAATVITTALFGAVTLGLTGESQWSVLAQVDGVAPAMAPARA